MAKIEEKIEELISKTINNLGYELYDIEYVKEGKDYYLRIFIEKPNETISIDDCEIVNNIVNPILDEADIIKDQYFLEISSTGIEKKLRKPKHYMKAIGKDIKIKLFTNNEEGKKEIEGKLKNIEDEYLIIEKDGKDLKIELSNVAQAKTIYKW